jgi:hypothetical protein
MNVILIVILALSPVVAVAHPFVDRFTNSDDSSKAILCAPILVKGYALLSLAISEKRRTAGEINDLVNTAFQIGYRGETLNKMGEKSNPALFKATWNESAKPGLNRDIFNDLMGRCVDLYNSLGRANRIDKNIQQESLAKINAEMRSELSRR